MNLESVDDFGPSLCSIWESGFELNAAAFARPYELRGVLYDPESAPNHGSNLPHRPKSEPGAAHGAGAAVRQPEQIVQTLCAAKEPICDLKCVAGGPTGRQAIQCLRHGPITAMSNAISPEVYRIRLNLLISRSICLKVWTIQDAAIDKMKIVGQGKSRPPRISDSGTNLAKRNRSEQSVFLLENPEWGQSECGRLISDNQISRPED